MKELNEGAYIYKLFRDGTDVALLPTEFADTVADIAYAGNSADDVAADEFERRVRQQGV